MPPASQGAVIGEREIRDHLKRKDTISVTLAAGDTVWTPAKTVKGPATVVFTRDGSKLSARTV